MIRFFLLCGLLALLLPATLSAQTITTSGSTDTVRVAQPGTDSTIQRRPYYPPIVPRRATIKSAILPGLGQIYIKQWWAVPVIYAGFATLGVFIYFNQMYYKKYLNAYAEILPLKYKTVNGVAVVDDAARVNVVVQGISRPYDESSLILSKNYYRRFRDLSYIGVAALWGLNVIEVNVAAHLKTFDETDDISWRITPGAQNQYAQAPLGATLTINFSSKPTFK